MARKRAVGLAQFAVGAGVLAGCSTLAGIKDDYHTAGDASVSGGSGGTSGSAGGGGISGSGGLDGGMDAGGNGGAAPTKLGAECQKSADCDGLTCLTATSTKLNGGGPSRGYCTKSCQSTPDCAAMSAGAICTTFGGTQKYCLLGCDPQNTKNCRSRYDLICVPLSSGPDAGAPLDVCIPQCATSNDCGGRVCSVKTGLCSDALPTGLGVGAPCDPSAKTDPCRGFCVGVPGGGGLCTSFCSNRSLNITGACGSNPQQGTQQDAACLSQTNFLSGEAVGICGQLCNCDSDCRASASGYVCESWASSGVTNPSSFESMFQQAGYCTSGTDPDGGTVQGIPNCP